jgi:hypothetical protein
MSYDGIKITLNINEELLKDFYKCCDYLHKSKRKNCFYNYSSSFQYIIKCFNKDMLNNLININSLNDFKLPKMKQNKEIGICIDRYDYNPFIKYCNKLNYKRSKLIRILINKLIKETMIE